MGSDGVSFVSVQLIEWDNEREGRENGRVEDKGRGGGGGGRENRQQGKVGLGRREEGRRSWKKGGEEREDDN